MEDYPFLVFVSRISSDLKEDDIMAAFGEFGDVDSIFMFKVGESQRTFAHVGFKREEGMDAAVKAGRLVINGHHVKISSVRRIYGTPPFLQKRHRHRSRRSSRYDYTEDDRLHQRRRY